MSILERLSAATRDLSVGGQISSLLGFRADESGTQAGC